GVDEKRVIAALNVVEEEGGTGSLHDAVSDLGDLELRAHGLAHVYELALFA
ncbi:MAG: hypothetical protein AVDCRST_MAG78-1011, partial [uncultured Rubrobacteraceae bacterium]